MSLSQRLTRQAAWAIAALVLGFGAVSWIVTAAHLYAVSRAEAVLAARAIAAPRPEHREADALALTVPRYRFSEDPAVWLTAGGKAARSPNASTVQPPPLGFQNLLGERPALVVAARSGQRTATVSWPLAADLDVMRDLLAVLALTGIVAGGVAWWLARWATRRLLLPVDRMTRAVEDMVAGGRATALPLWSGQDGPADEFNRLSRVFNKLLQALTAQAEREREMLREVAHEIRTPLQVLRGNLDLMAQAVEELPAGSDPSLHQESLEQSRQVIDRLARLVGDVLTVERMQAGRVDAPHAVDLLAVLERVVPDAAALAPALSVALLDRGEAVRVRATAWTVERALWAVLDNAIKYTPGGGSIILRVVSDGARSGVAVQDTGPGIAPEELPRVFDRFYRGRVGRNQPGSGLGLAMARALVEYDGGSIAIGPSPEGGTLATLWWPRWLGDPSAIGGP
jgi:signal transduction histidine kinase